MKAETLHPSGPRSHAEVWSCSTCTAPHLENRILTRASSLLTRTLTSEPNRAVAPNSSSLFTSTMSSSLLSSTSSSSPLFSSTLSSSPLLSSSSSTSSSLFSTSTASSSLLSSSFTSTASSSLLSSSFTSTASSSLLSSSFTSTASSSLLSTSSSLFSSPLLSIENTLLKSDLLLSSSSSSFSTSTSPYSSLSQSAAPPAGPVDEQTGVKSRKRKMEPVEADELAAPDEDADQRMAVPANMPALELSLSPEDEKQTVEHAEEFGTVETRTDGQAELLKEEKYLLLNMVCTSLVQKASNPGQKNWDNETSIWSKIKMQAKEITQKDPEFVLKVAIYTRQELNIRITANFLLALSAHLPATRAHLRRYFCPAVQLPSDWLEVIRIYSMCFGRSLPTCLKKALVDKFKQFSEYQLAKYNTRKHRGKHRPKKKRQHKEVTEEQWEKWANLVRADTFVLKKTVEQTERSAVDKKQSEFNMKKMIKRLHIKEPAEFVMGILEKRYPSDLRAFVRSGLSGLWQSERAGQRMKLKQPETWETRLSLEGNKAATWEKLIDSNSLPFMAMLRNLRNMITQGISPKHHDRILKRLASKSAVINSRQFPFRFLSAYKVITELSAPGSNKLQKLANTRGILVGILNRITRCKRYARQKWEGVERKRLRATLSVPFIYRQFNMRRKLQRKPRACPPQELLERYRQALEKAVQISCRYNIPPLSGHTIIIFNKYWNEEQKFKGADEFVLPRDKNDEENANVSCTLVELTMLLAMMVNYCCERTHFLFSCSEGVGEIRLEPGSLLDNVRCGLEQLKEFSETDESQTMPHSDFFCRLIEEKTKVDNIIVLTERYVDWRTTCEIAKYRKNCINDPLLVTVIMTPQSNSYSEFQDPMVVEVCGFSEQMLRFISERGSSRLLEHVERVDKLHNVPPPAGGVKPERDAPVVKLPPTPKLGWRGVRVFVSSTFRDMHAKRDVLVRAVFPELRRRAAPHRLYLQEVELRWGVTEEESDRAAELCLAEVCRCNMLLGILGERYGQVPPRPALPDLPQYSWLRSAPEGLSITEMEIRQFEALHPDSAQKLMLFYFRSPHLSSSVPEEWRGDFAAESQDTAAKMENLKKRIRNSDYKITENYSCEWGGLVEGRPCVKGLEDFARAALDDLWSAVQKNFVEDEDEADVAAEISEQEVHQDAQQRLFHGRKKLLSTAVEKVQECQQKGGVVLVHGREGEGKTVFMAALAHALKTPGKKSSKAAVCDVISYSTAASQSATGVENLLRCLVRRLRERKEQEEELPPSTSYRELLSELDSHLKELKKGPPLAVLVDGADLVQDAGGRAVSEWIPQHLPKGVCLVLSVNTHSSVLNTLSKKKACVVFSLGQLTLLDRKLIVQKGLDVYGKKLSDSAFNNQLQTLLMKKGAASPLFLHLACEELRSYASFETMKNSVQALPQSLGELVQHGLLRLRSQFGTSGLDWALAALTISTTGLTERDLYNLLNLCTNLKATPGPVTWHKVLHLARNPESRAPMAVFSQLVHGLLSVIHASPSHQPDQPLTLTHPEVRSAFEQLYLATKEDQARAHLILAGHLWVRSDPYGKDTFLHCDAEPLLHLPSHLMKCGQWEVMCFLLTSYYFMYANVHHGLLHPLLDTYLQFEKRNDQRFRAETSGDLKELEACHGFLKRHAPLLSRWPALFVQQALNEPAECSAHAWAERVASEGGVHAVHWLNNTRLVPQQQAGELVSTFQSEPSCVAVSPGGGWTVVGTEQGTLHLIHTHTNQEVKSLVSSCDGISGCLFLEESVLGTTSYDGQVEVWDLSNGCRTARVSAHSNRITGCDISRDRKHFATVSLDFHVKVWSSHKHKEVVNLDSPAPLNCVTFDPQGARVAVGCWDGAVRLWNWSREQSCTTLSGHQSSVRSVCFSPSSSLLCSGCLGGDVRLWSLEAFACVGRYQAHLGAAEALGFLPGGDALLSAGHDGTVQVWSGGLGRSMCVFGQEKKRSEPKASRPTGIDVDAALSVAVASGYAAVGYHGDGVKLYSLESGEAVWSTEGLQVSVPCLLWLESAGEDLLLSGALDHQLRLWRRRKGADVEALTQTARVFGVQEGAVLALAHNSSHVASASDDFTIALWKKSDLTSDPWVEPKAVSILRGHKGGVTCLAFSPDGDQLLSGGKDQALKVWNVDSPSSPVLTQSLLHCHRDWITACAWTPSAALSCSSDCTLCLWDVPTGSCIREVATSSPLSALCCWEDYVMLGSADGLLMVWKSDLGVIAEIQAHKSRLHHATVISSIDTGASEELLVATASEDGTVKLWHPLQVQHRSTLLGHCAAVQALVSGQGSRFLTVSEDRSLMAWSLNTESPPRQVEPVSALCFLESENLLVCGYSSGRLELWRSNSLLYFTKVNNSCVRAVSSMPNEEIAVGCSDCTVSIWRLERDEHRNTMGLSKVTLYTLGSSVMSLFYCSALLGMCVDGHIVDISSTEKEKRKLDLNWSDGTRVFGFEKNGENTMWILAETSDSINLALLVNAGPEIQMDSCYESLQNNNQQEDEEKEEEKKSSKKCWGKTTAAAMKNEFVVCGDSKGNMWWNQEPSVCHWTVRRPAHGDRISVVRLTDSLIVSGSYDRSVKFWDRPTKKQVGMFACAAAVETLEVDPLDPSRVVCGDALGQLYFLSWTG